MNTAPIDSYDGASQIFTFGANSLGVWLFFVLACIALVAVIASAVRHEIRSFAELDETAA
jgi:heme exporter protein D